MAIFLLLVAAGVSITGLISDNDGLLKVGWVIWAFGLLGLLLRKLRGKRKFRTVEEAQTAADAGNTHALRSLASVAKLNGDLVECERLLLLAVDKGDVEAMWDMGRLYDLRDGDLVAAEPWFRMAAEHGHFFAKRLFRSGHALNMDGTTPL
ncbi:sel1 repeat family protein [Kribbella antibiotica]|uniref:Sel1 repeat family protein n=1 Tax=Kribbella antibiotica TaxID=190195 RepID=A0A4R4YNQ3_9ACTN|nr:sel1 repeat family protein [Kribbella antibiotica]TDD46691.1 sel1 repeat family protein [Kribbella antibiotica]